MRRIVQLVVVTAVVSLVLASEAGAGHPVLVKGDSLRVVLQPAVVTLHRHAKVVVSGLQAKSVAIRLAGATYPSGGSLPWEPLKKIGSAWVGTLPTPALRGVYPVLLRTPSGVQRLGKHGLLLRVFALGTRERPSFDDPGDVARWWVRTVPGAKLAVMRPWPRPAFDRRDVRLHRLFVVAYNPPGHPRVRDRLGMFVTAVREGYHARWRLLEATEQP